MGPSLGGQAPGTRRPGRTARRGATGQAWPRGGRQDLTTVAAVDFRQREKVKTYIFAVEVEQDEDVRWSADIPTLPGCAAWVTPKRKH